MEKDRHYAEFSLLRSRNAIVGVCRPTVPTSVAAADTREGWGYHPLDGDAKLETVLEDVHVARPVVGHVVREERVARTVDHEGPVICFVDRVRRERTRGRRGRLRADAALDAAGY